MAKEDVVLMGPFVGEFYWEAGRFAPMLPAMRARKYKNKNVKYIVLTRHERFDLYGKFADILVPLKIEGDYQDKMPECFRLLGFGPGQVKDLADKFKNKYSERYNILEHIYPNVSKGHFVNKNQYPRNLMLYKFAPREENYTLVENFLPKNGKKNVIISPRFRKGFKRNWNGWDEFYDLLARDVQFKDKFNFIVCGKPGEYLPDKKNRFLDMNEIQLTEGTSLVGILLTIMENTFFVIGSQSAIPNIALLYNVEVLEFGCQKQYHTKTYNILNTPITFLEDKRYCIEPKIIYKKFKNLLLRKELKHGK